MKREYIVDFGDDKSSRFVRLAMVEAEMHGARLLQPVVRCQDCAWKHDMGDELVCTQNAAFHRKTEERGFCWKGERE